MKPLYLGECLVPYQYEYPAESWGEHGGLTMLDEDRAASSGQANYRPAADSHLPSTPLHLQPRITGGLLLQSGMAVGYGKNNSWTCLHFQGFTSFVALQL